MRTEQETFWAGEFGNDYAQRNTGPEILASRISLLASMLARTHGVSSVLELGANVGINMLALRQLLPNAKLSAVEINAAAHKALSSIDGVSAHHGSLLHYRPAAPVDLSFTVGVLIHIAPDDLGRAYSKLFESSARYVAIAEYYSPAPVEVPYRGHSARLFKRDFAGELMRGYPLRLVDYGFVYRGDPTFPADDITWFLMERTTPP